MDITIDILRVGHAPHDLGVGVTSHLARDEVEGERRQLLYAHDCDLPLQPLLLARRIQLVVNLQLLQVLVIGHPNQL